MEGAEAGGPGTSTYAIGYRRKTDPYDLRFKWCDSKTTCYEFTIGEGLSEPT
jgi:hypothetical protein